jgi:phage gpG-like protein
MEHLQRELRRMKIKLEDLDFRKVSREGRDLARSFVPVRTGRLLRSIRGSSSKNKAVVFAGGKRVPYAGAINYGWKSRDIQGAHFMQKADEELRRTTPAEIAWQIHSFIALRKLD